jgi:hypothetical protein
MMVAGVGEDELVRSLRDAPAQFLVQVEQVEGGGDDDSIHGED